MHLPSLLRASLLGCLAVWSVLTAPAQDRPRGIYVLGTLNSLSNIRTNDFVDGFTIRVRWDQLETAQGVYNFNLISNAIAQLQPAGKKLTLEIFAINPPAYVVSGASETWNVVIGGASTPNPVPWDAYGLNAWRTFVQALSNFQVADSSQGGALVPLKQHPTLAQIDAPVVGIQSIRDQSNTLRTLASYNRGTFMDAIVHSIHSVRDAFPGKFVFLGYFSTTDTQNASYGGQTFDQSLTTRLYTEFNSGSTPQLGFFQELLADSTPTTTGIGKVLFDERARTFTMFQALTSWVAPFTNPSAVASGNPATGIAFGYNTYGATYFELYVNDIDNAAHQDELRTWHTTLGTGGGSPPNTAPTMSALPNVSIVQSGTTDPITYTVNDSETAVASLTVTAASSNVSLVPIGNITLSTNPGNGATRYVCVTPQANLTGSATITLTVTDGGGLTAGRSFTVTVRAPAPAPLVPKVVSARNGDGSVRLDWNAETGGWYQVEYSADLITWRAAGVAINAATTSASWTDDGSATGTHPGSSTKRFYRVRPLGVFAVTYNGSNFSYTDADRTITGVWFKPTGAGTFPACIVSHGQGGTAGSYSADKANEFLPWGLGSIAPNYSHQANGDASPIMAGFSPENLARGIACRNILATMSWVDQNRVALWGHSKGAWLTIGLAGVIADRIVAAGNSAGGVVDDSAGVNQAAPTVTQASAVRAPWIMFHGDGDTTVLPAQSLLFQQLLNSLGVPNQRILYSTNQHNLHQDATINADMLTHYHTWLQTYGVLP
jgi:dienelactone hydrolase